MKKIFGTRFSLIGDTVMSLPILEYLKSIHGDYYLYFSIAKKCQQAAPLFYNQPLISEIKISDLEEDLGPKDYEIISSCDIAFNVKPPHPMQQDWYNYRNCVEETALMAGLDPSQFSSETPSLKSYWQSNPQKNCLAIWPFAGYGLGLERSPSKEWWLKALTPIINKVKVFHFGANVEPDLIESENYIKMTNLDFFSQIKLSLDCEACVGTDSGSMWCIGAYEKIPQLNLITNWLHSHKRNPLALAPAGKLSKNVFAEGGCSKINTKVVEEFVYENIRV